MLFINRRLGMDFVTLAFYIVLSFVLVFGVKISINKNYFLKIDSKSKSIASFNIGYFFLASIFIFFAVFRYVYNGYGGTDAYSYVTFFQEINGSVFDYFKIERFLKFWNYSESLFNIITLIFRRISADYHLYFLFTYGLIVVGLFSFVYNTYDKKSNFLTLILLFCSYLHSYNVMRGWMSIAICMFALIDIKEKRWAKSLVSIIIAVFFHTISIIFILVWVVCRIEDKYPRFFTRQKLFLYAALVNLSFFVGKNLAIATIMSTKYSSYAEMFNMPVSIIGYIPTYIICFVAVLMYPRFKRLGGFSSTTVIILAVDLSLLYFTVFLRGWRIHDYFAPIRMYMLSRFYIEIPKGFKEKTLIKMLINLYIAALFVQSIHGLLEGSKVFPYILNI